MPLTPNHMVFVRHQNILTFENEVIFEFCLALYHIDVGYFNKRGSRKKQSTMIVIFNGAELFK